MNDELWISVLGERVKFWNEGSLYSNLIAWYFWCHRIVWEEIGGGPARKPVFVRIPGREGGMLPA